VDPYIRYKYNNKYIVFVILPTILFIDSLLNNTLTNSRHYTVSC